MKTIKNSILLSAAIGAGLSLTSCVVPYDDGGYASTSVTTYRPGYTVTSLPSGYRSEMISGTNYYYYNGAYYQRRNNSYVVVEAPRSSRYYNEYTTYRGRTYHNHPDGSSHVIRELPRGYTTVHYGGTPYYQYQDRYYRREGAGYVVVARPF
ncbi:MAG: DUF6515 family protein [Verrucomicrobiota bacterium]